MVFGYDPTDDVFSVEATVEDALLDELEAVGKVRRAPGLESHRASRYAGVQPFRGGGRSS